MNETIIEAFHATSRLRRSDIFDGETATPVVAVEDANTPAPGWVGDGWQQGPVLIGINPGGGGDTYRRNPTDDQLYSLLRAFRDAAVSDREAAFVRLSSTWRSIQKTHNIWRVISAVLQATGESEREVSFMNVLPFRTRMDKLPSRPEITSAWQLAAKPQLDALKAKRIVCLGKKAWDVLVRFEEIKDRLVLIKRVIGDSYIAPEAQARLRALASSRDWQL
jgi:hypothetical protein